MHVPRFRKLIVLIPALALALPILAQQPPAAPVRNVSDKYFGQQIVDPYRWMEDESSPELGTYLKAQNEHTRAILSSLPGREKLLTRISELDQAGANVYDVQRWGGKYFYRKREPGADIPKLCVRDTLDSPERVLVDPGKLGDKNIHYAIDFFTPSMDGKYVAYGLSKGGSENSIIHVIETATGRVLPDQIDRCLYSYVGWHPESKSFFYFRMNALPPDAPANTRFKKLRAYWHQVGSYPELDVPVFGYGVSKQVEFGEDDFPIVVYSPASSYLFGIVAHGVKNEITLYAAPLSSLGESIPSWRKVVDVADDVTRFDARGDDLYLLTHRNASRFRIVKTSLKSPDVAHAKIVVPETNAVITDIAVAKDGLYYKLMDGGISRVRRLDFTGNSIEVPLPFQGAVLGYYAHPLEPGFMMLLTGWTKPPVWLAYDPETGAVRDTRLAPPWPVNFSGIEAVEVKAKAADGTLVPLSIVYPRGLTLDGSHPALLNGYGAYGISIEPAFSPTSLAWLERGGVLAFAHVRGGGEYGEDWHRAGMKATKMNTIGDFIACAQYLIDHKYTSPSKLAGSGTSAGGILIGGALTQRPDLFAAALSRVGVSNALRFEVSQGGPANVPEFGTVSTPEGFNALYAMDAYHHVRPNTAYPAIMLTTGFNDPRVPVWQPSKMAARLQAANSSGKPILLRVDYDAGHGLGSTRTQLNLQRADEWSFLLWQLGDRDFQPKAIAGLGTVTIAEGTPLVIRMVDAIDTETNKEGDIFRATIEEPVLQDGTVVIPKQTEVEARLVVAKSAGRLTGSSALTLVLTRLKLGDKIYDLETGEYTQQGASRGKRTAAVVGGGAALGAVIGAIAGGAKGAAIGAAAGAGAGTGVQALGKGEQIKIPSETVLEFQLMAPLTVTPVAAEPARREPLTGAR